MIQIAAQREYFIGDKPRPYPFEIRDRAGALVSTWDGSTVTAEYKNETQAASSFGSGNIAVGAGAIAWPTGTSVFIEEGTMRVDLRVTNGAYNEVVARIIFKVRKQ